MQPLPRSQVRSCGAVPVELPTLAGLRSCGGAFTLESSRLRSRICSCGSCQLGWPSHWHSPFHTCDTGSAGVALTVIISVLLLYSFHFDYGCLRAILWRFLVDLFALSYVQLGDVARVDVLAPKPISFHLICLFYLKWILLNFLLISLSWDALGLGLFHFWGGKFLELVSTNWQGQICDFFKSHNAFLAWF